VLIARTTWREYADMAAKFGLSPADRAKLKHDVEEQPDVFDELIIRRMNENA
jgi:hypothetical protein